MSLPSKIQPPSDPASSPNSGGAQLPDSAKSLAFEVVRQACHLAAGIQPSPDVTQDKDDRSPVTLADYSVQALIRLTLAEACPHIPMLAEESADLLRRDESAALRASIRERVAAFRPGVSEAQILDALDQSNADPSSQLTWVLDPIDGTKGFLRGGQYAIALALLDGGQVVFGILGCPNLPKGVTAEEESSQHERGVLLMAERGKGTHMFALDGSDLGRVQVSDADDPARAKFCESVEAAHSAHDLHARIADELGVTEPSVRMDSQAKYAALARGEASLYLRLPRSAGYQEKIWDHAAGYLVITEAGGRVTTAQGNELDFSLGRTLGENHGIVASNGPLHQRTLDAIATCQAVSS